MGFTPTKYTYKITFAGTELDGLEMSCTACTIGEWQEMLRMSSSEEGQQRTSGEVADNNDRMSGLFLDNVKSWNLEDMPGHPGPLPINQESFSLLDQRHGAMMITAWQKVMTEVPTNSPSDSSNGATLPEQSLGLASALEDLPNWPGPS